MTEGILIEISARFRRLEDIMETADAFHAERVQRAKGKLEQVEDDYKRHLSYARFCREHNEAQTELDSIEGVRYDLEKALEVCREDLASMQECLRKRSAVTA